MNFHWLVTFIRHRVLHLLLGSRNLAKSFPQSDVLDPERDKKSLNQRIKGLEVTGTDYAGQSFGNFSK